MQTHKTTVFDLFQVQCRYIVPLFQRGYVWTEDKQWAPLWDDIVDQAAATLRHKLGQTKTLQRHFLGAVVLNPTMPVFKRVPIFDIIDGQQRLTTLQIMLAAIRDETMAIDNEYIRANLQLLGANRGPFQLSEETFKVWPTSGMQKDLEAVLTCGSADELEARYRVRHQFKYGKWRPPRPGVVEAYLFFARRLRDYLDNDPEELPFELLDLDPGDRAELLVEALIKNIQIVTIALEPEDDAQVIFETLNDRGEPLTPSDLVRNFVFLTATREAMDVEQLYQELWREFEEVPDGAPFWKQVERQGRLRRPRLDLFLFHYIWYKAAEEIKINHLYRAFRSWWDEEPRDITQELQNLRRHASVYRELLAPEGNGRLAVFGKRMRAIDTSTVNPLVLYLSESLGPRSNEFEKCLNHLESFLIRRAVCGYNQKAYNRLFLDMLDKLRRDGTPSASAVSSLLCASQAESARWPSDEGFVGALTTDPLYRTFRPRPTQMLLEALELAMHSYYGEDITIHSPLTVEHVLPQSAPEMHWPLEIGDDDDEWTARARRGQVLHQLGNLTLVTQPMNSHVSNGPYGGPEGKREELRASRLSLNDHFAAVDNWNEAAIHSRGKALADIAMKVWSGPPSG